MTYMLLRYLVPGSAIDFKKILVGFKDESKRIKVRPENGSAIQKSEELFPLCPLSVLAQ